MNTEQMLHYQSKLAYEMDAADLFAALAQDENIVILDGRSPHAYEQEHIPNAINMWHKDMCSNSTTHLNKSKIYVCYCDGIGCNASTKAALKLLTLGFSVKELIGGLDWWKRDGYATEGTNATSGTGVISCSC